MSKLIDLTGKVFGNWEVLNRGESVKYPNGKSSTVWVCRCIKNPDYITTKLSQEIRRVNKETCRACPGCHEMDLTGKKFGRWNVLEKADDYIDANGRIYHRWLCQCDCEKHTKKIVLGKNLLRGTSNSCGCLAAEAASKNFSTHRKSDTRLYGIWANMRKRCSNSNDPAYKNYGGRGIHVCKEWDDFSRFEEWAMSHGYDDTLTIDRIDNNDGYKPTNCRWVDYKTQANNTRQNIRVTIEGVTHTVAEWSDIHGVPAYEIHFRMHHGWDPEKAVLTPLMNKKTGIA